MSKKIEDKVYGFVGYTDGGARPNPGYGGIGVHGYTFSSEPPKKGSGNPNYILTSTGYLNKKFNGDSDTTQVKPINYIDVYSSIKAPVTNTITEIGAACCALDYAINNNAMKVTIITDNETVVSAANEWIDTWRSNNWYKSNGEEVKNKDHWLRLDSYLNKIKGYGGDVKFKWIKGHADHPGNKEADQLATIGVIKSRRAALFNEETYPSKFTISSPDGYWNKEQEKNPLLVQRCLYMYTDPTQNVPGEYYLGNHGKDDELIGNRMADGYHSFVRLNEPNMAIENVRTFQINLTGDDYKLAMIRLDKLFDKRTHRMVLEYGWDCLQRGKNKNPDVLFVDGFVEKKKKGKSTVESIVPLSKIIDPPIIAHRAIDAVNKLREMLDKVNNNEGDYFLTNITDLLYDTELKQGKKQTDPIIQKILKKEFAMGYSTVEVNAQFTENEQDRVKINLILGIDLPHKNSLKKMETMNPTINVITWAESDQVLRYATIIKIDSGQAIYSGVFTNIRILSMLKKEIEITNESAIGTLSKTNTK